MPPCQNNMNSNSQPISSQPKPLRLSAASMKRPSVGSQKNDNPSCSDIFLQSDLHGLKEWYEATHWFKKATWTVILLMAMGLMIWQLTVVFTEFQESPILTTFSTNFEPEGLRFPKIYICPMSPIHDRTLNKSNVSMEWLANHNVSGIFDSWTFGDSEKANSILEQKSTLWESALADINENGGQTGHSSHSCPGEEEKEIPEFIPNDLQDYFLKIGYPVDTLFKECSFGGIGFPCSKHISEIFDKDYGKCFLLNLPENFKQYSAVGLSMVLNLDSENAFALENAPLFDSLTMRIGSEEFQMTNGRKTFISAKKYSVISLSAAKYQLIDKPGNFGGQQKCKNPEEGRKSLAVLDVPYDTESCRFDCAQELVLRKCDCILPIDKKYLKNLKNLGQDQFCYWDKIQNCAKPAVLGWKKEEKFKSCYKSCMIPCEFWKYKTEETASTFPSKIFWRAANGHRFRPKREVSDQEISRVKRQSNCATESKPTTADWKHYAIVDIAFPSLEWDQITQAKSMTFTKLVSEVGGQVGLWIGASIVTMIKFFVILIPILTAIVSEYLKKIRGTARTVKLGQKQMSSLP